MSANDRSTANDPPAAVNRILTLAHDADGATFTATCRVRLPDGKRATTTLAQQPPRFGFHVLVGKQCNVVISDGKRWRCTQSSLDDPTEVANTYPVRYCTSSTAWSEGQDARSRSGPPVARSTAPRSSARPSPPPSSTRHRRRSTASARDGVLAYASTIDGQIVELTGFKPSVDAGDLAVPR